MTEDNQYRLVDIVLSQTGYRGISTVVRVSANASGAQLYDLADHIYSEAVAKNLFSGSYEEWDNNGYNIHNSLDQNASAESTYVLVDGEWKQLIEEEE